MHESAAPWRALEDPATGGPSSAAVGGSPHAVVNGGRDGAHGWWIAGGLAVAFLLVGIAGWLAVSGGSGSIEVVGDRAALAAGELASSEPGRGRGVEITGSRGELVVDVQGAVLRPGVVRLPAGARVADAIAAAGGYGPRVAADRVGQVLNLAAALEDGDQVVVPSRDDPLPSGAGSLGGGSGTGGGGGPATVGSGGSPVDLNSATAAELDALPGIGPVTAAKIIAARDEQPFASVDDLRTRKIVGAATFDKFRDLVTVR